MSALARRPGGRSWRWPAALAALLAAHIGLWLGVVAVAGRDPSFSTEPGYYEKAVRWDEAAAQTRANAALGWSIEIDTDAEAGSSGERHFVCRIRDRDGTPVGGASVHLETFHHARAMERIGTGLAEEQPGVYGGRPRMTRPGLWECRLTVRRGGDMFTYLGVQSVGEGAWRR